MLYEVITNAFIKLGDFIRQFSNDTIEKQDTVELNDLFFDGFNRITSYNVCYTKVLRRLLYVGVSVE